MKDLIRNKQKKQGTVKLAGALGLLLALLLVVGLVAMPAMAVPYLSHRLLGEANILPCNIPVGEGAEVTAEIDGSWYATTYVDASGSYGYEEEFKVPGDDPDTSEKEGGAPGDTIDLFIDGVPAGTVDFVPGGVGDGQAPWNPVDLEVTDDVDPSGTIVINGEDACTNSRDVTLDLTWSDGFPSCGVVSMHFSNDNATWSEWEAVAATKEWTLTAGDEVKTVYVEFIDGAGNNSRLDIMDDITLDTTDPVIEITAPADDGCYTTLDTPELAYTVTEVNIDTEVTEGYSTAEGEHTVTVTVTDCAGNVGSSSVTYIVDNTDPVIEITGVSDGVCYNTDVTPVITITDDNLTLSSITLNEEAFVSGTTITEEGSYTLVATAEDCAGSTTEVTVGFIIDTTDPVVVITAPADDGCYTTAGTPELAYTVTEVNIDTEVTEGYSTAEGEHTVTVTVTDCAGNEGSSSVTYIVDNTDPVIEITGVSDGVCYNTDVTPVITFTDANLTSSSITLNGGVFVSGTTITEEGTYTLVATAEDCAGSTTEVTVVFIVDTTDPEIEITGVSDGVVYNTPVTPVITITDANLTSSSITLNGEAFVSGTTITEDGAYTLVATAEDCAGNTNEVTVGFTITSVGIVVTTHDATDLTTSSATPNGSLDDLGDYSSVSVSFEWGTTSGALDQETTPEAMTSTGDFSAELSGLASDTTYYFRAKATTDSVTAYGIERSFTTDKIPPAVTTNAASDITHNSATPNGNLGSLGDYSSVDVSFEWGTAPGVYTDETTPQAMASTGDFSAGLSGLASNTTYYYRAKATGSVTVYGDELSFTTLEGPPLIFIGLDVGWNTFSTPINLAPGYNTWGDLVTMAGLNFNIAWSYDGESQSWALVLGDYVLTACDAIYVEMNASGQVPIYPDPGPSVSAKDVYAGWNLVGSAFLKEEDVYIRELNVEDALISLYYAEGGLWGYTQVISPELNQLGWVYPRDGDVVYNMLIGKGYWVVMDNADEYAGQTTTPWIDP